MESNKKQKDYQEPNKNDDVDDEDYNEEEEDEENEEQGIKEINEMEEQLDYEINDSEDEGIEDYKINGYHPVHIGEILLKRYVIIQKLGWGHFSTVWLAKDFKYNTYVAIKIQKSGINYMESAFDEVEILQNVSKHSRHSSWLNQLMNYKNVKDVNTLDPNNDTHVIQLLNCFLHKTYYGEHFCMVFEILGVNLLEIIKRYDYKGVDLDIVKIITKQILIGLDFLGRECGIIHTDLKPENVILCLSQDEIRQIGEKGTLEVNQRIKYQQKMNQKLIDQQNHKNSADNNVNEKESDQNTMQNSQTHIKITKQEKKKQKKREIKKQKKQIKKQQEQINPKQQPIKKETVEIYKKVKRNELHCDGTVKVKIGDLGNACWLHHHFASQIQTRQYRAIETLLGIKYRQNTDIWSLMCMIFELMTGDFLFQPQAGQNYSKNEDHIAQIFELLLQENMDQQTLDFLQTGTKSRRYLDNKCRMKRIRELQYISIEEVLIRKYRFKERVAKECGEFLKLGLKLDINQRLSAKELLDHKWLQINTETDIDIKMTEEEYNLYQQENQLQQKAQIVEQYNADSEHSNADTNEDDGEDNPYDEAKYANDRNICDRSFTDLGYIGYHQGILLSQLDTTTNTQFNLIQKDKEDKLVQLHKSSNASAILNENKNKKKNKKTKNK